MHVAMNIEIGHICIHEHWFMAQNIELFEDNWELRNIFKPNLIIVLDLHQIMVPHDEILVPIQLGTDLLEIVHVPAQRKVTEKIDSVPVLCNTVPVHDQDLIHLFDTTEGSGAVLDNVSVPKVGVCNKIDHGTSCPSSESVFS